MIRFVLAAMLAVGFCAGPGLPAAAQAPRSPDQIQAEMRAIAAQLAQELARIDAYLIHLDQLYRLEVLSQRMSAQQADGQLHNTGTQLFNTSFTNEQYAGLLQHHRNAFSSYVQGLWQLAQGSAKWPPGQPAAWQQRAQAQLSAAWQDYEARLARRDDLLPSLLAAAQVHGWIAGQAELPPQMNPFLGQRERVHNALPAQARQVAASGQAAAPPPPPRQQAIVPPAAGVRAALSLGYLGKTGDGVGSATQGGPDGYPDGHFQLSLTLDQPAEIAYISLRSADANGNPVAPHHWNSRDASYWILGVWANRQRVNPRHTPTLGRYQGTTVFDLFAADPNWFAPGRVAVIEVGLANGQQFRQAVRLDR